MIFEIPLQMQSSRRQAITEAYRMDETACVENLLKNYVLSRESTKRIHELASQLVAGIRKEQNANRGLDSFLKEYDLSTEEGVMLMCLAEALLRTPDKINIDNLIRDKISNASWDEHFGKSNSLFVNAATWGLMLTGKILSTQKTSTSSLKTLGKRFLEKSGIPVIRAAINQAMRILGKQFVVGETIEAAIKRAEKYQAQGYLFSYDMLGEAACTAEDAERYFQAYQHAVAAVAKVATSSQLENNPGISVKLSALYPRYEFSQRVEAEPAIFEKLLVLAQQCCAANIPLTVDAEEADRLDISLNIIEDVFCHPSLQSWTGFGLAVQAYQKRAWYVIDWLADLARKQGRRIMIRLIKGAYWDSEIKLTQEKGFPSYPVFTRKASTDLSYLACAQKIFANIDVFYPMFASHNAHTVASIFELAGSNRNFEFQCLHGMGVSLYDQIVKPEGFRQPCRVYAPVGNHQDLLPYLVRRLLENGANSSFVNRINDSQLPIESVIADPVQLISSYTQIPNPKIPLPVNLYNNRKNSAGIDLSALDVLEPLQNKLEEAFVKTDQSDSSAKKTTSRSMEGTAIYNPSNKQKCVGWIQEANEHDIEFALTAATKAAENWSEKAIEERAELLEKSAELLEKNRETCMALLIREAGKTIPDAVSEIREAIDFCRYYAMQARTSLVTQTLPGPTGELNQLSFHGRGPMLCISPWNFPLAIFTGQVMAALVAGNPVLAKPAEQTPLIAAFAVNLFHQAGIPNDVLQLLAGQGEIVGAKLVADTRINGVLFTGSNETAQHIQNTLAKRGGAIVPFIAETGGQNAMLVDSSALPEQVVRDVIASAFLSAGQRCSALRVLFLQEEIADRILKMLVGAMQELRVGDPSLLQTDIGPVIDDDARKLLQDHAERMEKEARLLYQISLTQNTDSGSFFAPRVYEISSLHQLTREVFGPILHVIRFKMKDLDSVIESINQTQYGLTFGIHSRIDQTIQHVLSKIRVGNCYVNRNMIGAVVGVQPFGGENLSGTGPKAGGPLYLHRLCHEKSICINTTASGGNASLMAMQEEG